MASVMICLWFVVFFLHATSARGNESDLRLDVLRSRQSRDLSWWPFGDLFGWRRSSTIGSGSESNSESGSLAGASPRFLNIFQLVQIPNEECPGTNGLNGTCVSSDDCRRRGGLESGQCGQFGVCCTMSGGCGDFTRYNNSYFQSSGSNGAQNCQFTVYRDPSAPICQLKLTFETFTLSQPDSTTGQCTIDAFSVSGNINAVPVLCGENSGQHMYVDVDPNSDRSVLQMSTTQFVQGSTTQPSRNWRIRIQQIECNSTTRAPSACLQYFTGVSGVLKSFNFDGSQNGPHLANQNYAICIRDEALYCSMEFSASAVTNPFRLDQNTASQKGTQCTYDYITIAGISQTGELPTTNQIGGAGGTNNQVFDRHCGGVWSGTSGSQALNPSPAITFMKPYIVRVRFDNTEGTSESNNRGFSLNFVQKPCSVLGR